MEYGRESVVAMISYSVCSSSLLLVNKICMQLIPGPSFVSTMQFVVCTVFIMGLKASGQVVVDDWVWSKVQPYLAYVALFVVGIYCNMKALSVSNIETLIVFRSCCPIVVCVLDWAFLGRELPNRRSVLALLLIVTGAAGYVASDNAFRMVGWTAYSWVTAYFVGISIQMAYGKHIVGPHLGFKSMWGPTLYTNALSIVPMVFIGLIGKEPRRMARVEWTPNAVLWLSISCVVGVAISFTGWWSRSLVTATCYTILGIANKMVTVLVNVLIWDQHASPTGILSLSLCLVGAAAYQQAPIRKPAGGEETVSLADAESST
jgi:GDP-mannose transporter